MKCEICGKTPADGVTTLLRQNPKGQIGVWRCEEHNKKSVPHDVAQVVAELQYTRDGKHDA
jgi:hypothetical protein